jgi:hypothetical protein
MRRWIMADEKEQKVQAVLDILDPYFDHDWSGGIRRFGSVPWHKMESALLAAGDLADYAPWNNFIGTLALIKEAGKLEADGCEVLYHGYLVGMGREDTRLTLEGLEARSADDYTRVKASLRGATIGADEFENRGGAVIWWWD